MKLCVNEVAYELRGGAWLDEAKKCFYDVVGSLGNGYYLCREIGNNEEFALYRPDYNEFVPRCDMHFSLSLMPNENPTPSDLMNRFCANNSRYSFNRDRYFSAYVYDRIAETSYVYSGWKFNDNHDGTTTVTVLLKEKAA